MGEEGWGGLWALVDIWDSETGTGTGIGTGRLLFFIVGGIVWVLLVVIDVVGAV